MYFDVKLGRKNTLKSCGKGVIKSWFYAAAPTFNPVCEEMFTRAINLLVYGNFWVAAGATALSASTMIVGKSYSPALLAFTFFATLAMYGYARHFRGAGPEGVKLSMVSAWAQNHRWLGAAIILFGSAGALYFFFALADSTWPWLGLCLVLGAIYPLPLGKYLHGLRHMAGLKALIVCSVWALVTVVVPLAEAGVALNTPFALIAMQRFLFVLAIAIAFDVRDVRFDCGSMCTIPQQIGLKNARTMALFSLFLAEAGGLLFYFSGMISPGILIGQLLTFEATSWLLWRSTPRKNDFYFSFWLEGVTVLHFLLVFIFNYFWP